MPGCALHQNKDSIVQPKRVSKRGILKFYLLGPDNNIEFLKHFMNILLKI